ncbi:MAG: TIM barrel protein [Limimaricola sp.]|uniref:sugar phosphate isomerase/epimerase family protein n=1 Tax=Limimaricola sp. TaxID=2211665 RepID=UPI001E12CD59|nr:sugar phosphate isomerase/epimerase [Limimaricola sp.]MBI1418834.1 TIM barrel protein [Limimaricola sp.]
MPSISYQLYCSRNFPPLADTLSMLADAGFTEVEGFGGLYDDPAALKAQLDAAGLKMTTGHFGLDMVEGSPDVALNVARTMGMDAVIVPFVMPADRPTDAAGWTAFGQRLAKAGAPIIAAGLPFGWHNHDFEFKPTETGELPLDLIMAAAPDLKLELDLGWTARAGQDPVAWINKYAGRIIAVHVKDIAPKGEALDEDGWADVGHGTLDWAPIKAALDAAHVTRFVVEHDKPADHHRFATRSLAAVKAF